MRAGAGMEAGGMLRLRTGQVDLGRQRLLTAAGGVTLTTRETEVLADLAARAGTPRVPRDARRTARGPRGPPGRRVALPRHQPDPCGRPRRETSPVEDR